MYCNGGTIGHDIFFHTSFKDGETQMKQIFFMQIYTKYVQSVSFFIVLPSINHSILLQQHNKVMELMYSILNA